MQCTHDCSGKWWGEGLHRLLRNTDNPKNVLHETTMKIKLQFFYLPTYLPTYTQTHTQINKRMKE
jgi:hypothetical protein